MLKPLTVWITANWKILKEMRVLGHFTCLLRNLHVGQEQQLKPAMKQLFGSKLGKEYAKAIYCHLDYLTYIQSTSCKMPAWINHKLARRNINNLRYADDTTLMAKSEEKLKSLLMRVKEETEKSGLKFNIQKTEIMASSPIT